MIGWVVANEEDGRERKLRRERMKGQLKRVTERKKV